MLNWAIIEEEAAAKGLAHRLDWLGTSATLEERIRTLRRSIYPAEVQLALDLEAKYRRRLRRHDARKDSGKGRRSARADWLGT